MSRSFISSLVFTVGVALLPGTFFAPKVLAASATEIEIEVDTALNKFRASSGWEAGVDGSVALVNVGAGESIDTNTAKEPIVGFVLVNKGLMYKLTIEGSKFSKLDK